MSQPSLVIFRIGSLGDTVVALPCFHAIARAYPGHRKILLTNSVDSVRASTVEAVLTGTGLIDETLYFPAGRGRLVARFAAIARELRLRSPETLVYLAPRTRALQVYRDLLFFRALGIRNIIGQPLSLHSRECRRDPATGELEYEAHRLARVLGPAIPVDLALPSWDLRLNTRELGVATSRLAAIKGRRPLVAVSPGAKIVSKDWGEERWAALIRLLQVRIPEVSLVFLGAIDERPLTSRLA